MSTLFTNATIIDGSGAAPWQGHVLVKGERIAAVSSDPALASSDAKRIVDVQGAVLCPGFIDTHSHSDLYLLLGERLSPKLRQGITTEILGQDGVAMAPLPTEHVRAWRRNISGLNGDSNTLSWDWQDMAGYLKQLERNKPGVNAGCLAPHGNIRMEAMGLSARPATEDERIAMCRILDRELAAGALGLSTGLIYIPCVYADTRELTALCRVAARHDKPLVIHQRSEADHILDSMDEVLDLARATGIRVHFSHFKICGKKNAHRFEAVLAKLDAAKAEGLQVSFDQYPYTAGSTMLSVILPPWAHDGGTEAMLERIADPFTRSLIMADIAQCGRGTACWDDFIDFAGTDGIYITSVESEANQHAVGKNLDELGQLRNTGPLEAAMDLLIEEQNCVGMVDFYGVETHVEAFLKRPEMNVCTDGLLHGTPHPRTYGAFARVLGHYVRERSLLPLEEAVHKMTGRPAAIFGLEQRGLVREGYYADLVIFDPATVRDRAEYITPRQYPEGFRMVCVNGQVEVDNAQDFDCRAGHVLRG